MDLRLKVGVCRFSYKLAEQFKLLEVQETFYNLLSESRAERWSEKLRGKTELTLKVFQGITHNSRSPTWKRYKGKDFEEIKDNVGDFKLNWVTEGFWKHMIKLAQILGSKILLVQTPPSFAPTEENVRNFRETLDFLDSLRGDMYLAWEPRGKWLDREHKTLLESLTKDYEWLIHATDPFFHKPILSGEVSYLRLHGKPYLNYKYKFQDDDLSEMIRILRELEGEGVRRVYVLFNNISMVEDAKKFIEKASEEGLSIS